MTRKGSLSLEEELARIDSEIAKLETKAAPWRAKLAPIQDALHELRKTRQAKEAAAAGGRARRQCVPSLRRVARKRCFDANGQAAPDSNSDFLVGSCQKKRRKKSMSRLAVERMA